MPPRRPSKRTAHGAALWEVAAGIAPKKPPPPAMRRPTPTTLHPPHLHLSASIPPSTSSLLAEGHVPPNSTYATSTAARAAPPYHFAETDSSWAHGHATGMRPRLCCRRGRGSLLRRATGVGHPGRSGSGVRDGRGRGSDTAGNRNRWAFDAAFRPGRSGGRARSREKDGVLIELLCCAPGAGMEKRKLGS